MLAWLLGLTYLVFQYRLLDFFVEVLVFWIFGD